MDIERHTRMWTVKLGRQARSHHTAKVKQHARNALKAIENLPPEVCARRHLTRGPFDPDTWEMQEFARWRERKISASVAPRVVDRVTRKEFTDDVLESARLSTAEKRSGWRFITYRFPIDTAISEQEEDG